MNNDVSLIVTNVPHISMYLVMRYMETVFSDFL